MLTCPRLAAVSGRPRVIASYHNHTTWSDGTITVAETLAGARHAGCREVGISDHYVARPDGVLVDWSMPLDRLGAYCDALRALGATSGDIALRVGLELDYFPENETALREIAAAHPFDYLIGSVHFVGTFGIDSDANDWEVLSTAGREAAHRGYWERIAAMARLGIYDIAAHLDLTKKFGYYPTSDLSAEIADALDAIAAAGMVVELNTAGWHKPCEDAYPTVELLRACRARDIAATLSSDTHHSPEHLTRDFRRGAERLRAAGYEEVARFGRAGERWQEPLESAYA